MRSLTLVRVMPQQPRVSLEKQINFLTGVALRGARGNQQGWSCLDIKKKEDTSNGWKAKVTLFFDKLKGHKSNLDAVEGQWAKLAEMVAKAGACSKFNKYPWKIVDEDATDDQKETEDLINEVVVTEEPKSSKIKIEVGPADVHEVCVPQNSLTLADLRAKFPHDIMGGTDKFVEEHPAFRGIYGRGPQIRAILSSIWSFIESGGERSSHTLLWGKPACAKTTILLRILDLFGEGAALRLDSTSTTRAGLERLIFKDLTEVPPLIFMEEIEKADEAALRIWLGAMDERHEFRKVNFHMQQVRKVHFLAFATANDKEKFDLMMGGRPNYPGALSSRYVHQHDCPRPNEEQMRLILRRDVNRFGGKVEWIDKCVELASRIGTDDPRQVLGFLDGCDRLMDGSYQNDILIMKNIIKAA